MLVLLNEPTFPIDFQFPSSEQILNNARLLNADEGVAAFHFANIAVSIVVSIICPDDGHYNAEVRPVTGVGPFK